LLLFPQAGSTIISICPTITGTASDTGAQIEIRIDGIVVGTTMANAQGNFSFALTCDQVLSIGQDTLTVTDTDQFGNVSDVTTVTFTVSEQSALS
jgi:hypothetical protein